MNFRIGDRVRFKDREEMHRLQKERKIVYGWNENMDHLCGAEFTVKSIVGHSVYFKGDPKEVYGWSISDTMLDLVDDNSEAALAIMADDSILDMVMC